jgi:hypothetical protein
MAQVKNILDIFAMRKGPFYFMLYFISNHEIMPETE